MLFHSLSSDAGALVVGVLNCKKGPVFGDKSLMRGGRYQKTKNLGNTNIIRILLGTGECE